MKSLIVLFVLLVMAGVCNAGIVRVATYPVRHFVVTQKKVRHVVFFPIWHSHRTAHHVKRVIW